MNLKNNNIIQFKNIILVFIAVALGASFFPMIKIGYGVFHINASSINEKIQSFFDINGYPEKSKS